MLALLNALVLLLIKAPTLQCQHRLDLLVYMSLDNPLAPSVLHRSLSYAGHGRYTFLAKHRLQHPLLGQPFYPTP